MGGSSPQPVQAAAPPAPDYAAANREGIEADVETLPTRRLIDQAARLGRKVVDPTTGKEYDFSGLGDAELAREQSRVNAETAGLTAREMLALSKELNPQFIEEQRKSAELSDPTMFRSKEGLGRAMEKEVASLDEYDPAMLREVENDIRAAQELRGNTRGNAPVAEEVLGKFDARNRMRQQKLSNISQYISGQPISTQFASLSSASNGATPYAPVNYNGGPTINPNAGAQGANFASNLYGQQSSNYFNALNHNMQVAQLPNPWMQGIGTAVGIGTSLGGAALMACWVAEALWGKYDPRIPAMRQWVLERSKDETETGQFCREYTRDGVKWAEIVRESGMVRGAAEELWMMIGALADIGDPSMEIPPRMIRAWKKALAGRVVAA